MRLQNKESLFENNMLSAVLQTKMYAPPIRDARFSHLANRQRGITVRQHAHNHAVGEQHSNPRLDFCPHSGGV
jgi:hypothetical protein